MKRLTAHSRNEAEFDLADSRHTILIRKELEAPFLHSIGMHSTFA
jgi:hypothetical protein